MKGVALVLSRLEVAGQLRDDINRKYRPGDKLPTVRELANALGSAPNTVTQALVLLEREGLVQRRRNARAVVAESDGEPADVPAETKLNEAHVQVSEVQATLRDVRGQLVAVEKRVAEILAGFDR